MHEGFHSRLRLQCELKNKCEKCETHNKNSAPTDWATVAGLGESGVRHRKPTAPQYKHEDAISSC